MTTRTSTARASTGSPVLGNRDRHPEIGRAARRRPGHHRHAHRAGQGDPRGAWRSATRRASGQTMPGIYELLGGRVSVSRLRDVDIEDLLRREPVQTDTTQSASCSGAGAC